MRYFVYFMILTWLSVGYINVDALKLNFTPSDDEQLPLSTKYRDSLRKLCKLMKEGEKLPDNLIEKEAILKKQCIRLEKDDQNIAYSLTTTSNRKVFFLLLGLTSGLICCAFSNYFGMLPKIDHRIYDQVAMFLKNFSIQKFFTRTKTNQQVRLSGKKSEDSTLTMTDDAKAREARLKRFAEEKKE